LIVILVRFVLLLLLFNFVMHCIISTVVVAFEINYLILSYITSTDTLPQSRHTFPTTLASMSHNPGHSQVATEHTHPKLYLSTMLINIQPNPIFSISIIRQIARTDGCRTPCHLFHQREPSWDL